MDLDPKPETNAADAPPVDPNQPGMAMKNDPIANIILSASSNASNGGASTSTAQPNHQPAPHPSFEELDEEPLNLSELGDTDPLGPSHQGLHGMGDLAATLPFASQASSDSKHHAAPRDLQLPNVPTAPDSPLPTGSTSAASAGPSGPPLTQSAWESYVSQFDSYLADWNMFNQRMVNHFQGRQNNFQDLPDKWTTVASGQGLAMYMAGIEEDRAVRALWDAAWEKHRLVMGRFAKVRARAEEADLLES